jgi:two-component system chemotaxis response regulator CheB
MARARKKRTRGSAIPRRERGVRTAFTRPDAANVSGDLTDFGCPDCRGVLAVRDEGHRGHLGFACSIGHAYSGETLVEVKEDQLENTLWSAVEVYQEIALLHREMAQRARADGVTAAVSAFSRRAKRAEALATAVRRIIEQDSPAIANRVKG